MPSNGHYDMEVTVHAHKEFSYSWIVLVNDFYILQVSYLHS